MHSLIYHASMISPAPRLQAAGELWVWLKIGVSQKPVVQIGSNWCIIILPIRTAILDYPWISFLRLRQIYA